LTTPRYPKKGPKGRINGGKNFIFKSHEGGHRGSRRGGGKTGRNQAADSKATKTTGGRGLKKG